MIPLKDKVNVNPPSVPYPFGELRDNPGDNTGTPVDNQLMNDVMQLMEVLMANASITPNGLLENDTNGFQLLQAFVKNVRLVFAGYTSYGVSQVANQTVTNTGTSELHHVTPKGLNDRAATETLTGISEIATQAEVNAGTDSTRFITPQKLKGFLDIPWVLRSNTADITSGGGGGITAVNCNIKYKIIGKTMIMAFNFSCTNVTAPTSILLTIPGSVTTNVGFSISNGVYVLNGAAIVQGRVVVSDPPVSYVTIEPATALTNGATTTVTGEVTFEIL